MMLSSTWMADGYGGKRAYLRYLASRAEAALGTHAAFFGADLSRVNRLLFVCKGNRCRSPFAEYLARERFRIAASSGGLDADPGHPADRRALEVAWRRGIDLAPHRSRLFTPAEALGGDLVIAFEPAHALYLRDFVPRATQVTLLGLFASRPCAYLHDPYGLSERYFENCFVRIENALRGLEARLSNTGAGAGPQ